MCHQYMKFSDRFDQNPPCTFNNITKNGKRTQGLTLRAKVKVIAKIKRKCLREQWGGGGRHNSKVFLLQRTYKCLSHSTNSFLFISFCPIENSYIFYAVIPIVNGSSHSPTSLYYHQLTSTKIFRIGTQTNLHTILLLLHK